LDKLYAAVAEQGLSKTEYRKEIHDEITINRIGQQMVGEKIFVSPQEVDDFMRSAAWSSYNSKEYHLQDILIALPEKPSAGDLANAKDRVRTVFTKLHRGANFLEVAASEQGGDLGWRKLPEVPSAFANRVVAMKENETAGPIQTANGFHFIRLAGIRSTGMQGSKAEQHQQVQELLYQRKYEEALQTWMTKLRSESFVNTHPEN
jgi:peptidyl-prolyl cis-trans isomerase SurA